ncbi:MAG: right-handed parallel beta-helix repeat-containing protein [Bacteroidota bacterium]|nr:right-handed parallel beta-helix repeat-containing protein [Bacteroidota bacterium]
MKTIKLFLAIATATTLNFKIGTLNCKAQTSVPTGNVSGTWTLAGSPYNVQGSIQILDGTTLTIEPGVTVNFQGTYKLNVQGRLLAVGTAADTIIFTAANTSNGWRAVYFDNTSLTNDTSKIVYCKLQHTKATGSGLYGNGGAFYFENFPKAIISNCRISNSAANGSGGAIYCNGSGPIIRNNNISYNTVFASGGGIFCSGNATITNNTISNNISTDNGMNGGGGIWCSGNSTISNNTIYSNTTQGSGGGIRSYSGSPTISNNTILNNTSTNFGGGIYCAAGSPIITNNTIDNNVTSGAGGGIYCENNGNPAITNNIISNNTALNFSNGGGIYCEGSNPSISSNNLSNNKASNGGGLFCTGSSPTILDNIISNNTVSYSGGGICCYGSNPTIINNTIANNIAGYGGALSCENNSNPNLLNTIFWGNNATVSGVNIFVNDSPTSHPNFYYCDVEGGSAAFGLNGNFYTGIYQNNLDVDPLFVSPSGGSGIGFNGVIADWSLQSNSPCINTGDPSGIYPATDKAGNARVTVCRIDMGAYEYQNGIPFTASISQTQQNLCYGDSTASATIIVAGGIPTYTYLWSNGETTATASVLKAATYTVTVTETSFACSITKTITINEPAALSLISSTTNSICTNNNGSAAITVNGGTAPYTYLWSTNNNSITDTISSLLAGTYSVTVTDTNGCSILDSVTLVTQFPSLSVVSSFANASCYNNDGSANVIPNGGAEPYSYLWSNNSISQNLSNIGSGTYSVIATDTNGCVVSETLIINNSLAPISIPICMVTVDSSSTKNVIVWEKPTDAPIDSFKIYREVASVYTFVGSVPYDEVSEFTDNANGINPNTTSYKYKLSVLDTCGNESPLSTEHHTIHVQLGVAFPQGVNLSWNNYTGFSFSQYRILRDDLGNGNWQAIDSVSFGITTYTSTDVLPNAQYIVEATRPTSCVSTRQIGTTRSSSKSNTASQTTGVNELLSDLTLIISPNPSNGKFAIELSSSGISNNNKFVVKIYNVLGEQICFSELKPLTHNEIDLSNVPKGIYFVNVYNGDKIYTRKIVKQ